MEQYDVLIVGGGPAGAACAWKLQQAGARVLVLDKEAFPRSKPCAGWVTPEVWKDLEIQPGDYPHGLTVFDALHISIRGLPLIRPGRQYAVRRVEFDAWLLQRAGAPVAHHEVRKISEAEGGYTVDGTWYGKWLVGAGGTHCPVYHRLFKPHQGRRAEASIVAMEQEFRYPWKDGRCHLWFLGNGLPGYAWYVPKVGGWLNVGVGGMVEKMKARGGSIQQHWQSLLQKLDRLGLVQGHAFQPLSHVYFLNREQLQVQRGRALLIGDAAGLATLDMGEGIGPAIRSGILAAEAILQGRSYSPSSIAPYSLLPAILRKRDTALR